jgi:hypothetical protein
MKKVCLSNKWTVEDFKDRMKYSIGQEVYLLDYDITYLPIQPKHTGLKKVKIASLSKSTLRHSNKETAKIVYVSEKNEHDYIFEEYSWGTKEEALKELEAYIERTKVYYEEYINSQKIELDNNYISWKNQLEELKKNDVL